MAKSKSNKQTQAADTTEATVTAPVQPATPVTATNYTLSYRRSHPNNRCSYGIAGVPGLAVFDLGLFADGKPPATITLDCALKVPVAPKAKVKSATAAA